MAVPAPPMVLPLREATIPLHRTVLAAPSGVAVPVVVATGEAGNQDVIRNEQSPEKSGLLLFS